MSTPILGYWDIRGFGQFIRYILNYCEVKYEEKLYSNENWDGWLAEKFTLGLDFPNIPYWIDEDLKMTESRAIMKQIARKYKPELLGRNKEEMRNAEILEYLIWDILQLLVRMAYDHTEQKIEAYKTSAPVMIAQLAKYLGNKKWLTGDNLVYSDILAYETLDQHRVYDSEILKPHPNLEQYLKNFEAIPQITAFQASTKFIKSPINNSIAKLKF